MQSQGSLHFVKYIKGRLESTGSPIRG